MLNTQPEYSGYYIRRSTAFGVLGYPQRTIEDCDKALTLNPSNAVAYFNKGKAHYELDELDHALACFTTALRIDPEFSEAYNARGVVYASISQNKLALSDFGLAIILEPTKWLAFRNRAQIYFLHERYEHALRDMNYFIRFVKKSEAYLFRAQIFEKLLMPEAALADRKRAAELAHHSR